MKSPLDLLSADRALARERRDPCANLCTLANVDARGIPQARTLVLRDLEQRLAVFINATSPKYDAVAAGPVSVVVWLPTLNVQYRLRCTTEPIPDELVADSWQLRPDAPKRMDWYYTRVQPQGSQVSSRERLLENLAELDLPAPLHAPATAKGFFLLPSELERLDLNQENGVHDRCRFVRGNPDWQESVLVP